MTGVFDRAVVPPETTTHFARPEEQVSYRLADERLERRERAKARARKGRKCSNS